MEYRELGTTGQAVSVVGFGCWAMGGGWGAVDERDAVKAVHKALDLGINLFDTANIYGMGRSERLLAKALGPRRKDVVVATKVGLHMDANGCIYRSGSRFHIMNAVEQSLKNLRTDYIDLYQIHWPDANTPLEETMRALEELRSSGKVRFIGVSNFSLPQLKECLRWTRLDSNQPPFNMLMREFEKRELPFCRRNRIGVLTYGTLAYGLLTGKYNSKTRFPANDWRSGKLFPDPGAWQRHIDLFQGENFRRNLRIVRKLKSWAKRRGATPGNVATAWVVAKRGVTSALVGAKNPAQVEENVRAAELKLTPSEVKELDRMIEAEGD